MSVLIKGMKIPGVCYECYFCTYGFCAHLERYVTAIQERDADCPLVELPPHGRLIDADALVAEFYKQMSKQDELMELCKRAGDTSNYFTVSKIKTGMLSFLSVLNDAPTIIPAEEVQECSDT